MELYPTPSVMKMSEEALVELMNDPDLPTQLNSSPLVEVPDIIQRERSQMKLLITPLLREKFIWQNEAAEEMLKRKRLKHALTIGEAKKELDMQVDDPWQDVRVIYEFWQIGRSLGIRDDLGVIRYARARITESKRVQHELREEAA